MWAQFYASNERAADWDAAFETFRKSWQRGDGETNVDLDRWLPRVTIEWGRRRAKARAADGELEDAYYTVLEAQHMFRTYVRDRGDQPAAWPTLTEQSRFEAFRNEVAGMYVDTVAVNRHMRTLASCFVHVGTDSVLAKVAHGRITGRTGELISELTR
jgi:hypothetical protein